MSSLFAVRAALLSVTIFLAPHFAMAVDYGGPEVSYYAVSGGVADIVKQMRNNGRNGHFAWTHYDIKYVFETAVFSGECRLTNAKVALRVTMLMPQLVDGAGTAPGVRQRWGNFETALATHEQGHEAIGIGAAQEVEETLWRVSPQVRCVDLDAALRVAASKVLVDLPSRDAAYDRMTGHGRTQGAIFP